MEDPGRLQSMRSLSRPPPPGDGGESAEGRGEGGGRGREERGAGKIRRAAGSYYEVLAIFPVLYSISLLFYLIHGSLYLGEGNGTPLQDSCLENPMDGGA